MTDQEQAREQALERCLTPVLGPGLRVRDLQDLSMGASKELTAFIVDTASNGPQKLVLRRDPPAAPRPQKMALEASLLQAARHAAVPVPRLICSGDGSDGIGSPYLIMAFQGGETIPRKILRDDQWRVARRRLARRLGEIAGKIHAIPTSSVAPLDQGDPLHHWRQTYLDSGPPSPAFELAWQWLQNNRPTPRQPTLVHGDFRLGNIIVDAEDVVGVLDWELAYCGDPVADLGWACVTAWRYGSSLPVAGAGEIDELLDGYRASAGWAPTPQEVHWWTVFGIFRWGTMCRTQADRHLSGQVESLELALVGRRFAENEHDLLVELGYMAAEDLTDRIEPTRASPDTVLGSPDTTALLSALRHQLNQRGTYQDRVACHALDNIGRELTLGDSIRHQVDKRLQRAGVINEQALARRISNNEIAIDARVRQAIRAGIDARLQIWNPRYLQ